MINFINNLIDSFLSIFSNAKKSLDNEQDQLLKITETSEKGMNLIKKREGLELSTYLDLGGVPTIGYGHTGVDIYPGKRITKIQADNYLKEDLKRFEIAINENVKVNLTQNQFDALVSFVYNVGITAFKNSTLLERINEGDFRSVGTELMRWSKVDGQITNGLINRRQSETYQFYASI